VAQPQGEGDRGRRRGEIRRLIRRLGPARPPAAECCRTGRRPAPGFGPLQSVGYIGPLPVYPAYRSSRDTIIVTAASRLLRLSRRRRKRATSLLLRRGYRGGNHCPPTTAGRQEQGCNAVTAGSEQTVSRAGPRAADAARSPRPQDRFRGNMI
jgi:hypothetical protein